MQDQLIAWRRKSSRQIADCRVFRVREDHSERISDGSTAAFFVIENPDWVNIIALTPENNTVLIEQYRHGAEKAVMELPGGMIDPGETPEAAARRELLEETGYASDNWVLLGKSRPNPALQSNTIYHYLAVDCRRIGETAFDDHENINTSLVRLDETRRLVADGTIDHSLVVAAFYFLSIRKTL